jgi:hypothetical protein
MEEIMARRTLLLLAIVSPLVVVASAKQASDRPWSFAVSGDSRNCGDVVMPAIAESVLAHNPKFYWHLGDFRIGYAEDGDMKQSDGMMSPDEYHKRAWDDFIEHQIRPFGKLTVHLGIGNHELYLHGMTGADKSLSHREFMTKFAKWLGGASYYQWKEGKVLFINLDNSMDAGFDQTQIDWLERLLKGDASNRDVQAVVVGMHRALPNSLACAHSMNGDPYSSAEDNLQSLASGRRTYTDLWKFQNTTGKHVYVLASHSHFYVENIFDTDYWKNRNEKDKDVLNGRKAETILEGWLIGTAGAVGYRLPENLPSKALATTYAYGYLLGTVHSDGTITFEFQQVTEKDILDALKGLNALKTYGRDFVDFCVLANREDKPQVPLQSCSEQ